MPSLRPHPGSDSAGPCLPTGDGVCFAAPDPSEAPAIGLAVDALTTHRDIELDAAFHQL